MTGTLGSLRDTHFQSLEDDFIVSGQIDDELLAAAARAGVATIISHRPDFEEAGQPTAAELAQKAQALGLQFEHIPVKLDAIGETEIAQMRTAIAEASGPILAFCRSGMRAAALWGLARAPELGVNKVVRRAKAAGYDLAPLVARLNAAECPAGSELRFDVVIVGGGAAGIATAASLRRRRPSLDIAIVEPNEHHDYQPGWTLVGSGVFAPGAHRRRTQSLIPDRVTWLRDRVVGFDPRRERVTLSDGREVGYRILVVAPGLVLDWDAIAGLGETLGRNGVTSNYRRDLAPYTDRLTAEFTRGVALFTQPAMPIKCAGAPQKAMYLAADRWRRRGRLDSIEVAFHYATPALFGVADYLPALMNYVERYDIELRPRSTLVAVDGAARVATFDEAGDAASPVRVERPFDFLHAVPPQIAPRFVADSPLAGDGGFVAVDPGTLRHAFYDTVFSLGDACSAPNAKTAAAVRKQAPVVAENVLATLDGRPLPARYDGYGSCPLTVEQGKIVLAEFGYGGALKPSFPRWLLDGRKPTRAAWLLKTRLLPWLYWYGMLRGREWLAGPASA